MDTPQQTEKHASLNSLTPQLVRPPTGIQDRDIIGTPMTGNYRVDGAFGGSFAGPARDLHPEDAVPWYRQRCYFTSGWDDSIVWRSAVVECLVTACMIYVSGQFGVTLMSYGITQISGYVGIFNAILLSNFIYATASATGGHLNPMITFATFLCGLTQLSRATILIVAQTLGGILAGGLLVGSLGREKAVSVMGGGNFFDPNVITPGQALLTETISAFALLILAIGNGLDPRQQALYGHRLGPLLVGLSLGVVSCAGSGLAPGYTGPGMNPARALALAIAGDHWENFWVWWVGPALGGMLAAAIYNFAPPSLADEYTKKKKKASSVA